MIFAAKSRARFEDPLTFFSRAITKLYTLWIRVSYPFASVGLNFGTGLGGYASTFTKFNTSQFTLVQDYAHNDYLQFLAEMGGIGFLIAAAFFLWILTRSVRAAMWHPDHDSRWLGVACSAALVAILLHSFVDFNLYVPANATVLAWISGVASILALPAETTQRTRVSEI